MSISQKDSGKDQVESSVPPPPGNKGIVVLVPCLNELNFHFYAVLIASFSRKQTQKIL